MSRRAILALCIAASCGAATRAPAQVVVPPGGRRAQGRAATYYEPFADLERGRWGFSVVTRAGAANSGVSVLDALALKVLFDADSLGLADALGAIGLVPEGDALEIQADVASRAFLGGPFGNRLAVGFSGGVRVFGRGVLDSQVVSFLRDGAAAHPNVQLGASEGRMLALAEAGAHATFRLGTGPRYNGGFTIGVGARMLRPAYYASAGSTLLSQISLTADSVLADVHVEALRSADVLPGGSAVAMDGFLGWESPHHAAEVSVGMGGTLSIAGNERRVARFQVRTASLQEVADSLEAVTFDVADTVSASVTLPTLVNARVHLFWDRWIGAELGMAVARGGPFAHPVIYDAGLRVRLIPGLPLTAGVELTTGSLPAYYVRSGLLTTHFQLEVGAAGLGAASDQARGASGMMRIGLFF